MSKSVSGQNVEDMLSSVRRLVSSELPRNQRSRLPDGPGALVLTKELRVETAPPRAESAPSAKSLEERIAELEAAVDHQESEWEPDGSEDQTLHKPDRIVFRPSRPLTEQEQRRPLRLSEIALIETGPANEGETDEGEGADLSFRHEAAADEKRAADVSEAPEVPESFDDTEDTHGATPEAVLDAEPEPAVADAEPAPMEPAPLAPPQRFIEDPFADAIARDVAAVVAEMAEAALREDREFEAALAEAIRPAPTPEDKDEADDADEGADEGVEATLSAAEEDAVEADDLPAPDYERMPDGDHFGAFSEDVSANQEATTAAAQPEDAPLAAAAPTREERARALDDLPAAPTLGEEDLRPLISRMIRDELQGELGERITRNVRKLVRQEINRALSVRDLE